MPTDPPVDGPYVVASAVPADMAQFTKGQLPYDDALGRVAAQTLAPAWEAFASSKPDPTFLPASVLEDSLPRDLQTYAENCMSVDVFPAEVGQAFADADGKITTDAALDTALAKLRSDWTLPGSISSTVPGLDWHNVGGFADVCVVDDPGPGGFVKGPDGQYYALTPQQYFWYPPPNTSGQAEMTAPPGAMPGDGSMWTQTGATTGFVTVGKNPDASVKGAAIMMEILNPEAVDHDTQSVGKSVYDQTTMGPDGPEFADGGKGGGFDYSPGPTEDGNTPDGAGEAGLSALGAIGSGTEAGLSWANSMDSDNLWQYQIKYYQGPDGSRRAELDMYKIWEDKDGTYKLEKGVGYVGKNGQITVGNTTTTEMGDG